MSKFDVMMIMTMYRPYLVNGNGWMIIIIEVMMYGRDDNVTVMMVGR